MKRRRLQVVNRTRGLVLATVARIADRPWTRIVGLLGDATLAPGEGLWITPCNSIHSFGMRFRFDALFLDRERRIVHLERAMAPWRVSRIIWPAQSVLELPAGVVAESATELGDVLEFQETSSSTAVA